MIRLENVCKNFGDLQVLKNVNLEVKEGEKLVIIGPSGSGKSTTVRCMNFLEEPTSGHVYIDGQKLTHANKTKIIRESISMVFQQFNLFSNMDVMHNLTAAPVRIKGMSQSDAQEKALELLAKVGLADRADAYPSQLSGGQKQRCACARAIINNPKLLLADEPTGALDSHSAQMLLSTIQSINEQLSATILMVTHDAFTASYASRILFLQDGAIFTELRKGNDSRSAFFEKILNVLTMIGGGQSHVC